MGVESKGLRHGTARGYNFYKCRCDLCLGAIKKSRSRQPKRTTEKGALFPSAEERANRMIDYGEVARVISLNRFNV